MVQQSSKDVDDLAKHLPAKKYKSPVLDESQIRTELGNFLRSMRIKRGRKSSEVARALDKSVQYVCDIEMGRRGGSHLAFETACKWASYLNIPAASITKRQNINSKLDLNDDKARSYFRIVRNKTRATKLRVALSELSSTVARLRAGTVELGVGLNDLDETIEKIGHCLEYTR